MFILFGSADKLSVRSIAYTSRNPTYRPGQLRNNSVQHQVRAGPQSHASFETVPADHGGMLGLCSDSQILESYASLKLVAEGGRGPAQDIAHHWSFLWRTGGNLCISRKKATAFTSSPVCEKTHAELFAPLSVSQSVSQPASMLLAGR